MTFALSSATWQRIGGFDEGYCGYGGEDTDFASTNSCAVASSAML
nr:galactosyltransferase-related protein [Rarobacter faecitabidus]